MVKRNKFIYACSLSGMTAKERSDLKTGKKRLFAFFMDIKKSVLLIFVLLTFLRVPAQICPGSPDVLLNVTFGSGANPGPPTSLVTSNYTYTPFDCPLDNYYTIRNNTTLCYGGSWHSLTADHTGDTNGYFLMVDGSFTPGSVFVDTAKGLCNDNSYEFTVWMMNIDGPGQSCVDRQATFPTITLKVEKMDGSVIGVYDIGRLPITNTPEWKKFSVYFTPPAGVADVVVKIFDNVPGGCGNDFVLDDITMRHCETQHISFYGQDTSNYVKELGEGKAANVTLNCTLSSGHTNTRIWWQESTDRGKTWTDIPGAVSNTYVKYIPASTPVGYYLYRSLGTELLSSGSIPCRITSNVLTVHVIKTLFIPNAFSPNGDGVNDTWVIQAVRALSGFDLTVYDRTGTQIFQTNNYNKHWDGTYNGRLLPLGTYYYLIDFRDGLPKQKGYVTLVR